MDSKIQQVSRSVYALIGSEGATNFCIVKANDGSAAIIDADIRRIDEVEESLRCLGCTNINYVINTHEHFDHTSANFYFHKRGVPIVGSQDCARAMRQEGQSDFVRMMAPVPHLYERFPGLELTLPDVVFAEKTQLTLSGITLNLNYCAENGHSHSKGDSTIYVEEEEILIAGDLLYTEVHPVTFFGNIPNWLTSLKPLLESHYKRLIPGHGPTAEGEEKGKAQFKRMYDYLEDFYGNLQELNAGRKSPVEVSEYMLSGPYALLGKTRMVKRNIDQFLTGRWY